MAPKEMTLEELLAQGAQPVQQTAQEATLEELQALGAAPPPEVGAGETYVLRGAGALPVGGPVSDVLATGVAQALRRLGQKGERATLTPAAQAELEAMGGQVATPKGPVEEYRDIRDTRRLRTAAGSAQNPWAGRLGTATGIAATMLAPFLPKGSPPAGTGVLGRLGAGAATGAGYGALSGLTEGEADLTRGDVVGALRDTAAGGLFGGAFGLGGAGLVEAARPLAGALRRFALRRSGDVLQGGSDIASPTRVPLSDAAREEAITSGAIRPLGTTLGAFERLEKISEQRGLTYANIIKELEDMGVQGPEVQRLADEFMERYAQKWSTTGANKSAANEFLDQARNVSDIAGPGPGAVGPARARLGLTQAEELKRDLQQAAKFEKARVSGKEEATREVASTVRKAIEDVIDEAAQAPNASPALRLRAAQFQPVKEQLARTLEARAAGERGATKVLGRQPLGLKDYLGGVILSPEVGALGAGAGVVALQQLRSRLPSALATDTYALSQALSSGTGAPAFARGASGAQRMRDDLTDWAATEPVDQNTPAYKQALIRLLLALPKEQ